MKTVIISLHIFESSWNPPLGLSDHSGEMPIPFRGVAAFAARTNRDMKGA